MHLSPISTVLLAFLLLVNGLGLRVCWRSYRSSGYILPTAIAHIGLIFYGSLPALYLLLEFSTETLDLLSKFNLDFTYRILLAYLFSSLACLGATLLFRQTRRIWAVPNPLSVRALYIASIFGVLFTVWIYDQTWRPVGGIAGFLFRGGMRVEMNPEIFGSSVYAFFNYYVLYKMFLALFLVGFLLEIKARRRPSNLGILSIFLILAFPLINLGGGTRLIMFHFVIMSSVAAAMLYKARIDWRVVAFVLILSLAMNYIGNKRHILRECMARRTILANELAEDFLVQTLIPLESFTGYIPAYIVFESSEEAFAEPQYLKPLPRVAARMLGIQKREAFSELLALYGAYSRGMVVFTVPLPIDGYFGCSRSYALLFVYSLIVFGAFNIAARWLVQKGTLWSVYAYFVLMGLVWVYIRYDLNRSFSRTWQSVLFSIPLLFWLFALGRRGRFSYNLPKHRAPSALPFSQRRNPHEPR